MSELKDYKIFIAALVLAGLAVAAKLFLHLTGLEPIEQSSLHNALISSAIFVLGFVLSAVISDYKESERIPAEFASTVEDMYNDAAETHKSYPKFDIEKFRKDLVEILGMFRTGTRSNRKGARKEIAQLQSTFAAMEQAGVPPNFVVKLKQQQAQLMGRLFRVNYIQRIQFIPSAYLLVKAIPVLTVSLLLLTNVDPYVGGLAITGGITFIMTYMVILIHEVSVPFRPKGHSKDDVSLFLVREAKQYLESQKKK